MCHATEKMARAVSESLAEAGVRVRMLSMNENHRSQAAYEMLDAGALLVGSPTLNNNILPQMADVMTYLKGLRPLHKIGAAFGSFGWSGESLKQLESLLREMKIDVVAESVAVKNVPDTAALEKCRAMGKRVAEELLRRAGN
jgi:flavorubredoxin